MIRRLVLLRSRSDGTVTAHNPTEAASHDGAAVRRHPADDRPELVARRIAAVASMRRMMTVAAVVLRGPTEDFWALVAADLAAVAEADPACRGAADAAACLSRADVDGAVEEMAASEGVTADEWIRAQRAAPADGGVA